MTARRLLGPTVPLAIGLLAVWGGASAQQADEPALEERVQVDYVLIDFLVLDVQGRSVPDVSADELRLKVGGRKVPIDTLDRDCEDEAGAASPRPADASAPPSEPGTPRRIVLVFDYDHMSETAAVFDQAQLMIENRAGEGEQILLASFSELVRLETRFTDDPDELRWALRRMRNDRDLFARYRSRLTEDEFFERVRALFDLLERWPGRKTVVLFSGPFIRDGFTHDEQFRNLAALAAATRTSVYPVDTAGLRTAELPIARDPGEGSSEVAFGGPPELRRLANETGGRMTSETNDIGLAFELARRDMGCTYTLGFRDPRLDPDRDRNLLLKITRAGARVVYPDRYVVRSERERHASLVRTAALAPQVFESPDIRGELFVLGTRGENWDSVLGTEIRVAPGSVERPGERWDLRGFLRRPNGTIVYKFASSVAMPDDDPSDPLVADLFEPFVAPPGDYALSVVLADPRGEPRTSTRPIHLPRVPQQGPFLLGPILGHRKGQTFEPLMRLRTSPGRPLDALTVFCLAGSTGSEVRSRVSRWMTDLAGHELRRFEDASKDLEGSGVVCHEVLDALGTEALAPGSYEIHAQGAAGEWITAENGTEFAVAPPGGADTP